MFNTSKASADSILGMIILVDWKWHYSHIYLFLLQSQNPICKHFTWFNYLIYHKRYRLKNQGCNSKLIEEPRLECKCLNIHKRCVIDVQIDGAKVETVTDFNYLGSKITVDHERSHKIKKAALWKKSYDKPRQHIQKQWHHFVDKGPYSQSYGFSSSHVWMWYLDHKEDWVLSNWCLNTVVLEKAPESLLDSKEIKPVSPKGNQQWTFIGRTDGEAPIFWPPDVMKSTHWKRPDAGKDWGWEENQATEDQMVG